MDIELERQDRFRFLHRLWDVSGADEHKQANMFTIGQDLGFDEAKTRRVIQYLRGEGLARNRELGGGVGISHDGIQEVEEALSQPEQPTHFFPPAVSIISIGMMSNSTIQQASPGAVQDVDFEVAEVHEIRAVVQEVKLKLDELELEIDERRQAEAEVATIEAQLGSPKPRRTSISESLTSLRGILEGAAAAVVAAPLVAKIAALIAS